MSNQHLYSIALYKCYIFYLIAALLESILLNLTNISNTNPDDIAETYFKMMLQVHNFSMKSKARNLC